MSPHKGMHRIRLRPNRSPGKRLLAGAAVLCSIMASVLISSGPASANPNDDNVKKETICHATRSTENPYTVNSISYDSATGEVKDVGQGDHTSHTGPLWDSTMSNGDNWGDIIPPFEYTGDATHQSGSYKGLNWTTEGQAIWNNDCNSVSSSPDKTLVAGDVQFTEGTVKCVTDVVVYTPPSYTVGGNEHVVYDTTRGVHQATFGQLVTVNATGVDDPSKYTLTGQTTWSHTFGELPIAPSDCGSLKPPTGDDQCANMDGVQDQVPRGLTQVDNAAGTKDCVFIDVSPPPAPTHNTPAVAETGHGTSFPWLPAGLFATVLALSGLGLLRRSRRGQAF